MGSAKGGIAGGVTFAWPTRCIEKTVLWLFIDYFYMNIRYV